jgi:mannitol-1-/sugar-/sorbitol-6-phosphatase
MIVRAKGLLFDLDGTLIDSLPAVDRAWGQFAVKHGFTPEFIKERIHGRRSIDSIRELVPHIDADEEDAWMRGLESSDTEGVVALPGSRELLQSLPLDRWCVVTSGTSDVARARIAATGLPQPRFAVFGEDVEKGKPAPDPFLLGAQRLGFAPEECLGFEDTEAGLASIKAAGANPIAVGRLPLMNLAGVKAAFVGDYLELSGLNGV